MGLLGLVKPQSVQFRIPWEIGHRYHQMFFRVAPEAEAVTP